MIATAPTLTVAAAWELIDAIPSALFSGAPTLIAPLLDFLRRGREEPLAGSDLGIIAAVLPVILGLPWRAQDIRQQLVASWFGSAARQAQTLAAIALAHRYGHCLIDGEHGGVWVPQRLMSWLPEGALPSSATRWKLTPDFPVPVLQRLIGGAVPLLPLADGDIRPPLIAGTLAEVRLAAAAWAARFAWSGQPIADILALGGFDGLTAAALLLHRGRAPTTGWQEARRNLSLAAEPGWAGAVLAHCGQPAPGHLRQPSGVHAWMTADFETADSE